VVRNGVLGSASMHRTCTPPNGNRYIGSDENVVCAHYVSAFVTKALEEQAAAAATASRMVLTTFAAANATVSECMERPYSPEDLSACACAACDHVSDMNVTAGPNLLVTAAAELEYTRQTTATTWSDAQNMSSVSSAWDTAQPNRTTIVRPCRDWHGKREFQVVVTAARDRLVAASAPTTTATEASLAPPVTPVVMQAPAELTTTRLPHAAAIQAFIAANRPARPIAFAIRPEHMFVLSVYTSRRQLTPNFGRIFGPRAWATL
jgi:hypothetical protein